MDCRGYGVRQRAEDHDMAAYGCRLQIALKCRPAQAVNNQICAFLCPILPDLVASSRRAFLRRARRGQIAGAGPGAFKMGLDGD
jgi:hypothetical protein